MNTPFSFRKVPVTDGPQVLQLYRSVCGIDGCIWSDAYPNQEILDEDLSACALYGLYDGEKLIAAGTAIMDEELMQQDCFCNHFSNPAALERLCVSPSYQHHGLARTLLTQIEQSAAGEGYDGMLLLVNPKSVAAVGLYQSMGYRKQGETYLFDVDWHCYEKPLK
ncbi:MAG: GNAT family N-acetyltransferase [Eubacteriales bacterium]|nr:GNAT family N-acetyltransferase [Eubacteriales bacterium]